MHRVMAAIGLAVLGLTLVRAQHKIPPLPETAGQPVKRPSGLVYIDLREGSGILAEKGRVVHIHFTAWVDKTEVMFDYRDAKTGPYSFRLGEGGVLRGLDEGVVGMRIGGRRRLLIPPRLGHGSKATKLIPPNSRLTYDVELVAVSRKGA
jgi:FKBP-type peptidyl-prolyl cis-trans isomerase